MRRLNHAGEVMAFFQQSAAETGNRGPGVMFFDGRRCVASAARLGPARMVAPGTVAGRHTARGPWSETRQEIV